MAKRQSFLPGYGYIVEQDDEESFLPGYGYVKEDQADVAGGRVMSSLAGSGGLAGMGGIAGQGGGLAG